MWKEKGKGFDTSDWTQWTEKYVFCDKTSRLKC